MGELLHGGGEVVARTEVRQRIAGLALVPEPEHRGAPLLQHRPGAAVEVLLDDRVQQRGGQQQVGAVARVLRRRRHIVGDDLDELGTEVAVALQQRRRAGLPEPRHRPGHRFHVRQPHPHLAHPVEGHPVDQRRRQQRRVQAAGGRPGQDVDPDGVVAGQLRQCRPRVRVGRFRVRRRLGVRHCFAQSVDLGDGAADPHRHARAAAHRQCQAQFLLVLRPCRGGHLGARPLDRRLRIIRNVPRRPTM